VPRPRDSQRIWRKHATGFARGSIHRDPPPQTLTISGQSPGLHVVFASRAAHDTYQTHPRHLQFIAENKEGWTNVRVFDADVA
jgi:hypothetical protein